MKKLLVGICILSAAVFFGIFFGKKSGGVPYQENAKISQVVPKNWTHEEMDAVWDEISPAIVGNLIQFKWRYQEFGDHMLELCKLCKAKYGVVPEIARTYLCANGSSRGVDATAMMKDGKPIVYLFMPSLADLYADYENTKSQNQNWKQDYENYTAMVILHELEHLAYGYMCGTNLVDMIDGEKRTWAVTSEKVLGPLSKAGVSLPVSMGTTYNEWLKCGKNVESPEWEDHILKTRIDPVHINK